MAACVFGSVEAFNVKSDKWELWEEKYKFFLLANGVKDDAKKPMLLATVGMTALGYLHDLNMPTSLDDAGVTYTRLLEHLSALFGAKTTQLAARHEFGRLSQKESESVDDYAASLRTASVQCGFGADPASRSTASRSQERGHPKADHGARRYIVRRRSQARDRPRTHHTGSQAWCQS